MTEMAISVPVASLATAVGVAAVAPERAKEDAEAGSGSWERTSRDV
jgi:hypothetical protein